MKQYQQARIWNQIKYSYVTNIFIFIIIVLVIKENLFLLQKYLRMSDVRDKAIYEMSKTDLVNQKAKTKLDLINSDRGLEEYIRQAYPVTKSGESVITLYNATSSNVIKVDMADSAWQKLSDWWYRIYNNAIIDYTKLNN